MSQAPVWLQEAADLAIIANAFLGLAGFAFGYFVRGLRDKNKGEES